jgi:hypothetical protein
MRASCTLATPVVLLGGKFIPSAGVVPGGITPVIVLHYHGRIIDEFTARQHRW